MNEEVLGFTPDKAASDAPIVSVLPYPPVWGSFPFGGIVRPPPSGTNGGDQDPYPDFFWVRWIPPVGFSLSHPNSPAAGDSVSPAMDTSQSTILPTSVSVLRVLSNSPYKAHVALYDFHPRLIQELDQTFGYRGEWADSARTLTNAGGRVSFLVWDQKDRQGKEMKDGSYTWFIRFTLPSGDVVEKVVKSGLLNATCAD